MACEKKMVTESVVSGLCLARNRPAAARVSGSVGLASAGSSHVDFWARKNKNYCSRRSLLVVAES
jgi:hypothetical protein